MSNTNLLIVAVFYWREWRLCLLIVHLFSGRHPNLVRESFLRLKYIIHVLSYTVEPLNKGHIGTSCFVHYREVVLFLGGLKMYYC